MRRSLSALLIAAIAVCVPTAHAQGQAVFTPPPYNYLHVAPAKTITLKACNHIKIAVSVAVTYGAAETTQGWWGVPAGECKLIGPFDFQNGRIAYFATVGMDDGDRQNALYCLQMSAAFTTTKARRTMEQTCPSGQELHAFDVVKADAATPALDTTEWDFSIDF